MNKPTDQLVKVKLTRDVLIAGESKSRGDTVQVSHQDARTLVSTNKGAFATDKDEETVYQNGEAGVPGERVNAKTNQVEKVDYKGDVKAVKPNRPVPPQNRIIAQGRASAFAGDSAGEKESETIAAPSGETVVGEEKVKKTKV